MGGEGAGVEIRPFEAADEESVLALLAASLGWVLDERRRAFFRWKHRENPFGPSPSWVATAGERVVGFRTFQRWEFRGGAAVVRAVRAVDTATDPAHRGRGVFSRLTLHALDELRAEGVALVYNTPNRNSLPGYRKMGWREVGRLPVSVGLRATPAALARTARSRTSSTVWSEPSSAGVPFTEVLDRPEVLDALVADQPPDGRLRTRAGASYLAWRYGFAPLHYRALLAGRDPAEGLLAFRLHRRGRALEAVVGDVLVPAGDRRLATRLLRRLRAAVEADHVTALVTPTPWLAGYVPLPGAGPLLVCRPLDAGACPPLAEWALSLGDVEIF